MALRLATLLSASLATVVLVGCATGEYGPTDYTPAQSRSLLSVQHGTITTITPAHLTPGQAGDVLSAQHVAPATGAALGAAVGSTIGDGKGHLLATIGGAVAGGMLGSKVEQHAQASPGLTLVIQLASMTTGVRGRLMAVTQQVDSGVPHFYVGEAVLVLTALDGTVRVVPTASTEGVR